MLAYFDKLAGMKLVIYTVALLLTLPLAAQAGKEAVYVGEGRFLGQEKDSVDSAVLRQRNQEQTIRAQERNRDEERYERSERRERLYDRERSNQRY